MWRRRRRRPAARQLRSHGGGCLAQRRNLGHELGLAVAQLPKLALQLRSLLNVLACTAATTGGGEGGGSGARGGAAQAGRHGLAMRPCRAARGCGMLAASTPACCVLSPYHQQPPSSAAACQARRCTQACSQKLLYRIPGFTSHCWLTVCLLVLENVDLRLHNALFALQHRQHLSTGELGKQMWVTCWREIEGCTLGGKPGKPAQALPALLLPASAQASAAVTGKLLPRLCALLLRTRLDCWPSLPPQHSRGHPAGTSEARMRNPRLQQPKVLERLRCAGRRGTGLLCLTPPPPAHTPPTHHHYTLPIHTPRHPPTTTPPAAARPLPPPAGAR